MKIVEGDLVDWEPLRMRFVPSLGVEFKDTERLREFLSAWFVRNSSGQHSDCEIRYWNVSTNGNNVEAVCEHLTKNSLRRLVKALAKDFPELATLHLGIDFEGVPSGLNFKWVRLLAGHVTITDETHEISSVAISLHQVSIGQFEEFMLATGYVPDHDKTGQYGPLLDHVKLNYGRSGKAPIFGVSHNDASAFCEWANLRLPSEPELHHFFVSLAEQGHQFDWAGDCWTTTKRSDGTYIVRNGPYCGRLDEAIDHFRETCAPDWYDYPFPTFRVARSLE